MAALTGAFAFWSSFMTKVGANFTASVHAFELTSQATILLIIHLSLFLAIIGLYLRNREVLDLRVPKIP